MWTWFLFEGVVYFGGLYFPCGVCFVVRGVILGGGGFFWGGGLVFGDGFHLGAVYFVGVVFISVCFSL